MLKSQPLNVILPDPLLAFTPGSDQRLTVVFRSERAGEDNPVLGDRLMIEFCQALLAHPDAPQALLFYNSGVHLVLDGSPVLDIIRQLAGRGSEVLACRTSLQLLAAESQPAVGRAAALAELVERMRQASLLLWP
jgi:intracellular sulfur oxidation DsrE/DsrF family protein